MIGLTPEQAQLAWERAVEKAAGRKITARLVKAAVQELQLAPATKPATRKPRQTKPKSRWPPHLRSALPTSARFVGVGPHFLHCRVHLAPSGLMSVKSDSGERR